MYLMASEETQECGGYVTSFSRNDWESGVGVRKERSSDYEDMEENWDSTEYDRRRFWKAEFLI